MVKDRMQNPFFEATEANARQAIKNGLPVFLTEPANSTPVNATPYLLNYSLFRESIDQWPERRQLADQLDAVRTQMGALGFSTDAILIGGSFTELTQTKPADVDCLIFYRCQENADPSQLADIQKSAREKQIDCRLVPIDGDPLMLLKLASYFSIYYSISRGRKELARGLLLLDCREEA